MRARRWSVATRVAWWFVLTNTLVFLGLSGLSRFLILREMAQEGEDPAEYQFEGAADLFERLGRNSTDFTRLMKAFGTHDLTPPIGLRIASRTSGATISEFFHPELPARLIPTDMRKGVTRLEDDLRWYVDDLDDEHVMGLLLPGYEDSLAASTELDPFAQMEFVQRYQESLVWFAALAAAASALVGAFLGRRISRSLQSVAADIRAAREHHDDSPTPSPGAPDEVLEVTEALHETLAQIHDTQRRSRLLVAGLTHELSAPVQNLISEGEISLLRKASADESREVVASMLEEARALGRVMGNLMALVSQPEADFDERESFDVADELELRLGEERRRADGLGITFAFRRSGATTIVGDRESIVLAIRNVVDNAIKWSPPDGRIELRVDGQADAVEFQVDDQGPGVAEQDRKVIFDAFHQATRQGNARAGYGMGLALAKTAVEAHDGTIRVESSPSGGARFRIRLPQAGGRVTPRPDQPPS